MHGIMIALNYTDRSVSQENTVRRSTLRLALYALAIELAGLATLVVLRWHADHDPATSGSFGFYQSYPFVQPVVSFVLPVAFVLGFLAASRIPRIDPPPPRTRPDQWRHRTLWLLALGWAVGGSAATFSGNPVAMALTDLIVPAAFVVLFIVTFVLLRRLGEVSPATTWPPITRPSRLDSKTRLTGQVVPRWRRSSTWFILAIINVLTVSFLASAIVMPELPSAYHYSPIWLLLLYVPIVPL
jgi:hypothetical protein